MSNCLPMKRPAFSNLEQLSQDEQTALINAYKNQSHVQANGLRLAGQKYFTLQIDDRSIYLKNKVRFHRIDVCIILKRSHSMTLYLGRWRRDRQDETGHPRRRIRGASPSTRNHTRCRRTCRSSDQRWILDSVKARSRRPKRRELHEVQMISSVRIPVHVTVYPIDFWWCLYSQHRRAITYPYREYHVKHVIILRFSRLTQNWHSPLLRQWPRSSSAQRRRQPLRTTQRCRMILKCQSRCGIFHTSPSDSPIGTSASKLSEKI